MILQARDRRFDTSISRNFALILVLAAIVAFVPAVGFSEKDAATKEGNKAFDAHATAFSYFFDDSDMDFHFGNLILGSTVNHGAEIGEAFYAASQLKDGNAARWQDVKFRDMMLDSNRLHWIRAAERPSPVSPSVRLGIENSTLALGGKLWHEKQEAHPKSSCPGVLTNT